MNIAHLLPYSAVFPLKKHNGRYEWALRLANIQARNGHEVTIYAGPASMPADSLVRFTTLPVSRGATQANNAALFELAMQDGGHQILHSHFDSLHYEVADETDKPVVVTQHWFPTPKIAAAVALNTHRNVITVPVTKYMAAADRQLGIPATEVIYHGIDLTAFKPSGAARTDRLLFVGRIAPHKGVHEAVQAILAADAKLDIVGKINAKDQAYWDKILPSVDGKRVRYLGPKSQAEVAALMNEAKAMLFLPQSMEAFGQTIIEAQACGTPVILNDLGANSELVDDGVTGYLVQSEEEITAAIGNVSTLDAQTCRAFAEQFDLTAMVRSYDELYHSLL